MEVSYINLNIIIIYCFRFGTSERKDVRRENWPGPGDTDVPDYTTGTQKKFSKRDPG